MPADDRPNRGKLALLIEALASLVAREHLTEVPVAARPRRPSLWRTLLAREALPAAPPASAGSEGLPSLLLAREPLPPPPPAAPRSTSFLAWLTGHETLPEETDDVR